MGLHLAGILWFGCVPFNLFNHSFNIILSITQLPVFSWTLLFVSLLVVAVLAGFKASNQVQIRQSNIRGVSKKIISHYFVIRILFLFSYELFFRGYLLFDCMHWWGVFPAILVTTGLTVLIHVFTNQKEMWACIPFGILLSCCCIGFNAVWPAIVLHISLSLAYELPPVNQFLNQLKPIK